MENKENLFVKLQGYAKENFTTEIFVFLLNNYSGLRKRFLLLLKNNSKLNSRDKHRIFGCFGDFVAKTQSRYDKSVIDMELLNKKDSKKIFIENKLDSPEGDNQIQKYLNLEVNQYVGYLTPIGYDEPRIKKNENKYLGHFFWNDVYAILSDLAEKKKEKLIIEFLKYMEEIKLRPIKPLTENEIKHGNMAFDFITKSEEIVKKVNDKINWKELFGAKKKDGSSKNTKEGLIYYWYRARGWKTGTLYIEIGIARSNRKGESPFFYVGVGILNKFYFDKIIIDLGERFENLKKKGWVSWVPQYQEYYKKIEIPTGEIDEVVSKLYKESMKAFDDLIQLRIIGMIKRRIK